MRPGDFSPKLSLKPKWFSRPAGTAVLDNVAELLHGLTGERGTMASLMASPFTFSRTGRSGQALLPNRRAQGKCSIRQGSFLIRGDGG